MIVNFVEGRLELESDRKIGDGRGGEPVPLEQSGRLKDAGRSPNAIPSLRMSFVCTSRA